LELTQNQSPCIDVAIVEDDTKVLSHLASLIGSTEGFDCVGRYRTGERALEGIPHSLPDVVLMDIQLPGMDGVECARRLKNRLPDVLIVMLTEFENTSAIIGAFSAGACGCLLKRESPAKIFEALRGAYNGGSPMTGTIARRVVSVFHETMSARCKSARLSRREHQVMERLAQGFTYHEIAAGLALSYSTVHTHIRHIYKKLQVNSRTEAVVLYLQGRAQPESARPKPRLRANQLIGNWSGRGAN